MNRIVAYAAMLLKLNFLKKHLFLIILISFSINIRTYSQTTVIPVRYWTFNQNNAALDSTGNSSLDFASYGSAYTQTAGNVGKYITLGSTGNLTLGGNVTADTFLIVEFLFKPGALFNNTKFRL